MAGRGGFPPVLKKYGQHFLKDQQVLAAIADATGATADDTVIEIGPGRGELTDLLAARAGRVIAIEVDRALAELLRERYGQRPASSFQLPASREERGVVDIIEGDVLKVALGELAGAGYVLAGNVPYYITTPIIFHALVPPLPRRAVFLVQAEVADRMTARPGSKEYGALSVNLQTVATVESLMRVPAHAFHPPPKVDSAVVRITPGLIPENVDLGKFRTFVQSLFSQRRKQLQKSLRSISDLSGEEASNLLKSVNIDPAQRPEEISPGVFLELFAALSLK